MSDEPAPKKKKRSLGFTAALCGIFVAGMVGMSFAAVPLYRIFCQVTGYGGTTQQAERAPGDVIDREMTVRFDANIANGLGWSFRPENRSVRVEVGKVVEVAFLAENRTGQESTGVASFNVSPGEVGAYFNKISCFCFDAQTLAAHEQRRMTVVFFVDPAIARDRELNSVDTITLSYSFYPGPAGPNPVKPVASVPVEKTGKAL